MLCTRADLKRADDSIPYEVSSTVQYYPRQDQVVRLYRKLM